MSFSAGAGLLLMIVSEAATLARIEPFWSWNTPIAWSGFLLFADGIIRRRRGSSWMTSNPREFIALALASIPLWLVFEFYNSLIDNWYYVGLPENTFVRYAGYAWSYATIWPAIFEGAELVAIWRRAPVPRDRPAPSAPSAPLELPASPALPGLSLRAWSSIAAGGAMLTWPLVRPSRYLAAPVWLGFILLLDPINARLGGESLTADLRHRRYDRMINLALSGLLCGCLWEFWNYWARSKWHYTVPIMERLKLFEMPLPGYLGFPAFALECFTMYVFIRLLWVRLTARGGSESAMGRRQLGRTIAL